MNYLLEYFYTYSSLAVLIPLIAAITRFKKLGQPINYVAILVFADFLAELISHIIYYAHKIYHLNIDNHFIWPLFISIEFGLIAWIYRHHLRSMFIAKAIPILIIVFTSYIFIDWFFIDKYGLSHTPHFIESFFILFFVLSFFYKTLKSLDTNRLERSPMFWLSVGLFIYFSGDVIIFIFSDYMLHYSIHLNNIIWNIHAILNILLYISYTLAICLTPKKLN